MSHDILFDGYNDDNYSGSDEYIEVSREIVVCRIDMNKVIEASNRPPIIEVNPFIDSICEQQKILEAFIEEKVLEIFKGHRAKMSFVSPKRILIVEEYAKSSNDSTNKLLAIGRNSRFRDLQTCIKNELICKGLNEMVSIEKADIPDFIRKEKGLPPKTINTIGITIDMSFL